MYILLLRNNTKCLPVDKSAGISTIFLSMVIFTGQAIGIEIGTDQDTPHSDSNKYYKIYAKFFYTLDFIERVKFVFYQLLILMIFFK